MAPKIIGVFGAGNLDPECDDYQNSVKIGRLIAQAGHHVLTGGRGGVMEAASLGAKEAGGTTIGILPHSRGEGMTNSFVDIPIYTGMGEARNVINIKSCDSAIAIGGEYGTLSEIALALKMDCPVVLLNSWTFSRDGKTPDALILAENPEEAVTKALSLAKAY